MDKKVQFDKIKHDFRDIAQTLSLLQENLNNGLITKPDTIKNCIGCLKNRLDKLFIDVSALEEYNEN